MVFIERLRQTELTNNTMSVVNCYGIGPSDLTGNNIATIDNVKSTYDWDYTTAKNTIGIQVDGYNHDLKWHIPGFNEQWGICDSVDENGFDICNGSVLYCENSKACDYGSIGSCNYPDTNYNCNGSYIGICDNSQACNNGLVGVCNYPDPDYNCNGSYIGIRCEDSTACDYGEMGSCSKYSDENYNCNGSYIGTYCEDSKACDYGEMGSCSKYSDENYNCNGSYIGI